MMHVGIHNKIESDNLIIILTLYENLTLAQKIS